MTATFDKAAQREGYQARRAEGYAARNPHRDDRAKADGWAKGWHKAEAEHMAATGWRGGSQ